MFKSFGEGRKESPLFSEIHVQKEIIRITRSKLTCALEMESEGSCRIVEKAPLLHSWYVFVFYQQNLLL
jgi:hypothetical protein